MAIVIEGILKRNGGNRAYLIFRDSRGQSRIVRIRPVPDLRSGETVTVVGRFADRELVVERMHRRIFPRRQSA